MKIKALRIEYIDTIGEGPSGSAMEIGLCMYDHHVKFMLEEICDTMGDAWVEKMLSEYQEAWARSNFAAQKRLQESEEE